MAVKSAKLTIRDQQALQAFVAYLQASIPDQIKFVALFGSKARGDSQKDLILIFW